MCGLAHLHVCSLLQVSAMLGRIDARSSQQPVPSKQGAIPADEKPALLSQKPLASQKAAVPQKPRVTGPLLSSHPQSLEWASSLIAPMHARSNGLNAVGSSNAKEPAGARFHFRQSTGKEVEMASTVPDAEAALAANQLEVRASNASINTGRRCSESHDSPLDVERGTTGGGSADQLLRNRQRVGEMLSAQLEAVISCLEELQLSPLIRSTLLESEGMSMTASIQAVLNDLARISTQDKAKQGELVENFQKGYDGDTHHIPLSTHSIAG